jgi:hypothetical protein
MLAQSSAPTAHEAHEAHGTRWSRFLAQVRPAHDPDRLVPVAEVAPGTVALVEGSLTDADIPVTVREVMTLWGAGSRFQVLVPARSAAVAEDVVRELGQHPDSGL